MNELPLINNLLSSNFCIFKQPIKATMTAGYVPVDIPTKKYIAAYVHFKLGKKAVMDKSTTIGSKMFDLLQHSCINERETAFSKMYNDKIRFFIPYRTFLHRGGFLNATNITNLNLFIEAEIKNKYRSLMDDLILIIPSFEANLPFVRKRIGIDIEAWSDDSIKKDYYRYRKKNNLPPLYNISNNNIYAQSVPSGKWY